MLKKTVLFALVSFVLVHSACTQPSKYLFNQLYLQKDFTGRSIYRKTLEICPVLFDDGFDTSAFTEKKMVKILKKAKPKIIINQRNRLEKILVRDIDSKLLESFYKQLYRSDKLSLQTSDSIWSKIESDFLLVISVRGGYVLQRADRRNLKKINVETELWDCEGMNVVWRGAAENVCVGNKKSDYRLLFETVKKIFVELPSPIPTYDDKNW